MIPAGPRGPAGGLPGECVLAFDALATVPKALLTERIAELPAARLPELCDALAVATGC